jgi:signal peptidase I
MWTMIDTANDLPPEPIPVQKSGKKPQSETREFVTFLIKLLVVMTMLRTFIIAPFNIPTESMVPRLLVGDYLLVSKWPYGYSKYSLPFSPPLVSGRFFASTPKNGDVAVFKAPPGNKVDYIKRVIGIAGDRVQMKGGQLFLNGKPVEKRRVAPFVVQVSPNTDCFAPQFMMANTNGGYRCEYPRFIETLPNGKSYEVLDLMTIPKDDTEEFVVPKGYLFMMGDNRDNSKDSRFSAQFEDGIGLVPEENLVGRALVTMFSTDGSANWFLPWTWFTAARWERSGHGF